MAKKMLIDATHPEEVRVAVVDGSYLVEYETETSTKKQFKGNIYLAKVIRIEPSLQAAFVEFGGNRHGFLPFNEIHPDYYRIPVADRKDGSSGEENLPLEEYSIADDIDSSEVSADIPEGSFEGEQEDLDFVLHQAETESENEEIEGPTSKPRPYRYKIQEVIKHRQIMLVQVAKEERGNKGAALTTYLSLPGRYCVFMPNAGSRSGGGVSRKIIDGDDRKRLKSMLSDFNLPEGMSLIVRTAGQERNKSEIKRDYEYLCKLWDEIREKTLSSIAPSLVYAEGDLVQRAIRDIYSKEVDEILIEGEEAFKKAKTFMKKLIPSHMKKVKQFTDHGLPLFFKYRIDEQVDNMMNPLVSLPSGGSIVINATEALVAIDVNSGKATRERHIDETAFKTNLEAAEVVARQIRLRDLAGIVVIDFIDMHDSRHVLAVEKHFRESVKTDRARIQIGKISQFGLLEFSRQRLRPSIMEANTMVCSHCSGTGLVRSIESMALMILRGIEEVAHAGKALSINVYVPAQVDLYLLNQKRTNIIDIEKKYQLKIMVLRDDQLSSPNFRVDIIEEKYREERTRKDRPIHAGPALPIEKAKEIQDNSVDKTPSGETDSSKENDEKRTSRRDRFRRRNKRRNDSQINPIHQELTQEASQVKTQDVDEPAPEAANENIENSQEQTQRSKRRRPHRRFNKRPKSQENGEGESKIPQVFEDKGNAENVPKPTKPEKRERTPEAANESDSTPTGGESKKKRKGWWNRLIKS